MKIKQLINFATIFCLAITVNFVISQNSLGQNSSQTTQKDELSKKAKITLEQARETALKHTKGEVVSSELEREHGKVVYSFDIRTSKDVTEIQVSAITGRIVRVEHEDAKKEEAEKKKEAKETNKK